MFCSLFSWDISEQPLIFQCFSLLKVCRLQREEAKIAIWNKMHKVWVFGTLVRMKVEPAIRKLGVLLHLYENSHKPIKPWWFYWIFFLLESHVKLEKKKWPLLDKILYKLQTTKSRGQVEFSIQWSSTRTKVLTIDPCNKTVARTVIFFPCLCI